MKKCFALLLALLLALGMGAMAESTEAPPSSMHAS